MPGCTNSKMMEMCARWKGLVWLPPAWASNWQPHRSKTVWPMVTGCIQINWNCTNVAQYWMSQNLNFSCGILNVHISCATCMLMTSPLMRAPRFLGVLMWIIVKPPTLIKVSSATEMQKKPLILVPFLADGWKGLVWLPPAWASNWQPHRPKTVWPLVTGCMQIN